MHFVLTCGVTIYNVTFHFIMYLQCSMIPVYFYVSENAHYKHVMYVNVIAHFGDIHTHSTIMYLCHCHSVRCLSNAKGGEGVD